MSFLLVRPIRDIVYSTMAICSPATHVVGKVLEKSGVQQPSKWAILKGMASALKNLSHAAAARVSSDCGLKLVDLPSETQLIKAALRTYTAALGAVYLYKMGGNLAFGAVLGTVISLPATLIAAGTYGTYWGTATVVSSCYSGSLATLGIGVSSVLMGLVTLEYHDITIASMFKKLPAVFAIANRIGLPTKKPLGVVEQFDVPHEWQKGTQTAVRAARDAIKTNALFERIFSANSEL